MAREKREAWEDGTLGPDMAMGEAWEDGTLGPDMAMEEAWEDGTLGPDMAMEEAREDGTLGSDMATEERGGWEDGTLGPDILLLLLLLLLQDGTLGPRPRIMEAGVTSIKIHVQGSCVQGFRARSREESQSGNQSPIDPGSEETTMTT